MAQSCSTFSRRPQFFAARRYATGRAPNVTQHRKMKDSAPTPTGNEKICTSLISIGGRLTHAKTSRIHDLARTRATRSVHGRGGGRTPACVTGHARADACVRPTPARGSGVRVSSCTARSNSPGPRCAPTRASPTMRSRLTLPLGAPRSIGIREAHLDAGGPAGPRQYLGPHRRGQSASGRPDGRTVRRRACVRWLQRASSLTGRCH